MTEEKSAAELRDLADAVQTAEAFARGDVVYGEQVDELPPRAEVEPMVVRGVRLPVSLDLRVRAAAAKEGVPFSALIREWIELGLTEMDDDKTIPLSVLRRAIAHATQAVPGQAA